MRRMAPSENAEFAVRSIPSLVVSVMLVMITSINVQGQEEEKCGLWLGPSPIKEAEDHGWGHSIFTGKHIQKGTVVLGSGVLDASKRTKVSGDLFVPVYDWESIDMASFASWDDNFWLDDDNVEKREKEKERIKAVFEASLEESRSMEPPLFHYLWNGESYPVETLESEDSMRAFTPGISTLCPCTSKDFNLAQFPVVTHRDWRATTGESHDESPPPPEAGSFSYLSNAMFVASRDILPGEELIVECTDNSDNFDPTKYGPTEFKPKEAGGFSICLDDKVEERLADHTPNIAAAYGGQLGLFAKRKLQKGETLTSTPMVPVHKEEMTMDREKYAKMIEDMEAQNMIEKIGIPPQKKQLLLNYMFGHPESSLLWLAITPLLLAANHAPHHGQIEPNAKLQWHQTDVYPDNIDGKPLSRRQQFHHAELLEMDSNTVALKFGMGLMVDLVALRDINEDEEILIDYGKDWDVAWKEHKKIWDATIKAIQSVHVEEKLEKKRKHKLMREGRDLQQRLDGVHHQKHVENSMTALPLSSYVTADDYNNFHYLDNIRTVLEQRRNPYPSNIETACYFESDWLTEEDNNEDATETITFESWYNMVDQNSCLLPCMVMERREYVPLEEHLIDDDDYVDPVEHEPIMNGGSITSKRYSVKLFDSHEENTSIPFDCHIFKRFEYHLLDVPREGIIFVNKQHSTDQWIDQAFRQPIALPDDMVPTEWRDLSRRKGTRGGTRKKKAPPVKEMTKEEEQEEKDYTFSVKRWNEAESRRDKLEDMQDKWLEKKYSPLFDL